MSIEVVKIQEFKGHSQAVYSIEWDKNSNTIFSGSGDGMLVNWSLDSPDGKLIAKMDSSIYTLSSIDRQLFIGTRKGILTVFDCVTSQVKKSVLVSNAPIFEVLKIDGGILVATGDGYLHLLDFELRPIEQRKFSEYAIRSLVSTGSGLVAGTSGGETIYIEGNLNIISRVISHQGTVFALAYDASSGSLFSGGKDAHIKMFANGGEIASVPAHNLHVHRLCINSSGERLLSASMDKTIKLWDTKGLKLLKVIDFERCGGHVSSVNKILWIDKNTIISCSDDRTLKCFEIRET